LVLHLGIFPQVHHDQEQFFYSFRLDDAVPQDHAVHEVAAVLDLGRVHSELAPYYPRLGRPSIDPVLMIRMLIVGYVFGIRSERALCFFEQDVTKCCHGSGYIERGFGGCAKCRELYHRTFSINCSNRTQDA
jgi:hypothetical protein